MSQGAANKPMMPTNVRLIMRSLPGPNEPSCRCMPHRMADASVQTTLAGHNPAATMAATASNGATSTW